MAANPNLPIGTTNLPTTSGSVEEGYHIYHSEAFILTVDIEHPVKRPPESFGRVVLDKTRRESLLAQSVGDTNIAGLFFFDSGRTSVSGTQIKHKTDIFGNDRSGWFTLAAAAIKGYNVLDIITADRVVAHVSTEHPMANGKVPRVNFIGTRFDNLRVGGYPVEVELDLSLVGDKPEGDRHYLRDRNFLDRVHRQFDDFADSGDLPESLETHYGAQMAYVEDLKKRAKEDAENEEGGQKYPRLKFSLVKKIKPIPLPGVTVFGNHIFIENFGLVTLAEVEIGISKGENGFPHVIGADPEPAPISNYFDLNMLDLHLGSPTVAKVCGPDATANGQHHPGNTP